MKLGKILLILIFGWTTPFTSLTAQSSVEGSISGYREKKVRLLLMHGDKRIPVDSTKTDETGHFNILPDIPLKAGMYLLETEEGNSIRLLINGLENIRLISGGTDNTAAVEFVQSEENRNWYAYSLLKSEVQYKQDLLKPILRDFPQSDTFYMQTKTAFNKLQQLPQQKASEIIAKAPGSLAARFIQADLPPTLDLSINFEEQRDQLKAQFFNKIDFSDTDLINSDILSSKMIDYLSLHQRPNMNMLDVQLEFIRALDVILQKASVSNEVYVFAIEYFIDGFYRMGLSGVSDYLSTLPHLNKDCMDTETYAKIEQIVGPFRKIVAGAPAPSLTGTTIQGETFDLSKLENEKTIIVFWSLTCPHCLDLIPELQLFAKEHPETSIVSIILSPDNNSLREYIAAEAPQWIHIAESKGWSSSLVEDFMVYGTPTLFLLDAEKNILSKPSGMDELNLVYKQ